VVIYSQKVKSTIFGAQYLHKPIPGISPEEPELEINVKKFGTRAGYAANVYGDPKAEVSWDKFNGGPTPGWDLKRIYDTLWEQYEEDIIDVALSSSYIAKLAANFDLTFSTIPIQMFCKRPMHTFAKIDIWVVHGPLEGKAAENVMVYNGIIADVPDWYRYSLIRGYQSWEFSLKNRTEDLYVTQGLQVNHGIKPLGTNCNCHPEIIRLGRFGKWNKHVFTHHAYDEVRNALL